MKIRCIMKLLPEAKSLLGNLDARLFYRSGNPVCILDRDFRILGYNRAWETFALDNDGEQVLERWPPGACVLDALPDAVRGYYERKWADTLDTGEPFREEYDCSSPTRRRRFLATVYPLGGNEALLQSHSLLLEEPLGDDPEQALAEYRNADGLMVQCSHCRRVQRQDGSDTWDWVPVLEQRLLQVTVSHGFCPWCLEHHHPA